MEQARAAPFDLKASAGLDIAALAALKRVVRDRDILTAYARFLVPSSADPRRESADAVRQERAVHGRHNDALTGFDHAAAAVAAEVERLAQTDPRTDVVVFADREGIVLTAAVPGHVATTARWQRGIWATPYINGLGRQRPVVAVLADDTAVYLYRALPGDPRGLVSVAVDRSGEWHGEQIGAFRPQPAPPIQRSVTSVHGTGADTRDQIAQTALHRLNTLLSRAEGILLGGSPAVANTILNSMRPDLACRAHVAPELTTRTPEDEIRGAIDRHAAALREAADRGIVDRLRLLGGPHGRSVAGWTESLGALHAHRVGTVLLSQQFVSARPNETEDAIDLALEQAADVEILTGAGAAQLDRIAGGVGALLIGQSPGEWSTPARNAANRSRPAGLAVRAGTAVTLRPRPQAPALRGR